MNLTLYKREMKGSWKLLVIFGAVLTMYVAIIISMYEPDMLKLLDSYAQAMPELMAAVGMTAGAADLLGFMISYLYGFILLVFPMVYCILRANGLVAKYVDRGSMACLLAAPVRRGAVALTQAAVLISGTVLMVGYVTGLELAVCQSSFPGELAAGELLAVNGGACLPASVHRRRVLSGLLRFLRHKVQRCLRCGRARADVPSPNAGQRGRRGRKGPLFHLLHPL